MSSGAVECLERAIWGAEYSTRFATLASARNGRRSRRRPQQASRAPIEKPERFDPKATETVRRVHPQFCGPPEAAPFDACQPRPSTLISEHRREYTCAGFIRSFADGSRRRRPAAAWPRRSKLGSEHNGENMSAGFIRNSSRRRSARCFRFIRARRFPSFCAESRWLRLARLPGFVPAVGLIFVRRDRSGSLGRDDGTGAAGVA
jgi:hypothetical protein